MIIAELRARWPYTARTTEVVPGVPPEAPRAERFRHVDVCADCGAKPDSPHRSHCRMGVLAPDDDRGGGPQWGVEPDHVEARPFCQDCLGELRTDDGDWFTHRNDEDGIRCWVQRFLRPRPGWFLLELHAGNRTSAEMALRSTRRSLSPDRRSAVRAIRWDPAEDVHVVLVYRSFETLSEADRG